VAQLVIQHVRQELEKGRLQPLLREVLHLIYQAGDTLAAHAHPLWHFWYVMEGCAQVRIGDGACEAQRGDLFLIPGGTVHGLRVAAGRSCHMFDVKFFLPALDPPGAPRPSGPLSGAYHTRDAFGLRALVQCVLLEIEQRGIGWEVAVNGMFCEVLSRLVRHLPRADWVPPAEGPAPVAAASPVVRETVALLSAGAAGLQRPSEVARRIGVSARQLNVAFRAATGFTLRSFMLQQRMALAQRLLLGSDLPVKAVAREAGYAEVYAFSRAFRRAVGLPPSEFRRRGVGPSAAARADP
jgi:AraC-like DNA-binding protein